ncbi:sensor histidine kinase [Nitrincola alkalilacustris]|uniref:sensor histidine kinase n=1 Tax=Nitrincola alkalilacustris TaxID=1571224 RepID=UPI00124EF3AD|nr:ATP-binding protein [Nitrincola alkalilacustris]
MTESEEQLLLQRIKDLEAQLEAARQEQLEGRRLRNMIALMPNGVLIIDNRGMVSECNPAAEALLGVALEGESWLSIITACFAPRPDDGHEVSLKNGKRVSLATLALPDEPGQLVFISDQTQTRDLQAKLHHYQRLSEMGRMMASLAHQVRTPLSAALLYASHLMADEVSDEQRIRFAGKVKARLVHLEQQVRDMLVFARGETRLENRISSDDLLLRIEELLDQPLVQYDADCDFINQAPSLQLQCNLEMLLGALLNLVNNALQAAGKGCELSVTVSQESDKLRIAVRDDGPGMDESELLKAQEPFYTTKSHGTGLGLAIAHAIARAHHGVFELQSTPGQGTVAAFVLPCMLLE